MSGSLFFYTITCDCIIFDCREIGGSKISASKSRQSVEKQSESKWKHFLANPSNKVRYIRPSWELLNLLSEMLMDCRK